jgi:hypothetical protein
VVGVVVDVVVTGARVDDVPVVTEAQSI